MRQIPIDPRCLRAEGVEDRRVVGRLLDGDMVGGPIGDIHDREFGKFKAGFGPFGGGMIELSQAIGAGAAFGDKGTIEGRDFRGRLREPRRECAGVIGHKVEWLAELPSERFFVKVAVPAEIAERHPPSQELNGGQQPGDKFSLWRGNPGHGVQHRGDQVHGVLLVSGEETCCEHNIPFFTSGGLFSSFYFRTVRSIDV